MSYKAKTDIDYKIEFLFLKAEQIINERDLDFVLTYLKENNIDVNIVDSDGNNLLHAIFDQSVYSYNEYKESLAFYLIDKGINVNHTNHRGDTPLRYAFAYMSELERPSKKLINKMIKTGASLSMQDDYLNQTPLHLAIKYAPDEYFEILLDAFDFEEGLHSEDMLGETPADLAMEDGKGDILAFLNQDMRKRSKSKRIGRFRI